MQTFAALGLANLTYAVAQTLLIPSLADIEHRLHTTPVGATALMSVFFVSGAVTAGVGGRLGDMIGKRRILLAQLAFFTAGALVCALSDSLVLLIAGRALMGLTAALFPLSASIVRDELPLERATRGIASLAAMLALGAAFGLACGGLVSDHLGYQWVFWISVIMGVLSIAAVVAFVPGASVTWPGSLDLVGAVLLALGLAPPLLAISETPTWGWTTAPTFALTAFGLLMVCAFVLHERRVAEPLLDVRLLAHRQVASTNVATFLVGFGMFGASAILSQFFQVPARTGYGFGASATQAGLFLLPGALLIVATSPLAGRLSHRVGPRPTLLLGAAAAGLALALMAVSHDHRFELYAWPALMYVGNGFSLGAMPTLILDAVPAAQRGQATAVNQVFRLVGSSVGTQLAAALITSTIGASALPREHGFTTAFTLEAAAGAAAVAVALTIPRLRFDTATEEPEAVAAV